MRRNAGEVVVAVAAVLWSGWLLFGTGHPSSQTVSNLGLTIVPFVAAVACVRRAWLRSAGAMRWSWMLLGGSCAAWGVGQLIWTVYETGFGREVPFPSWADAGYLMAVPLAAAGLIVMPAATQTIAGRLRIVLDGVMVAVALFCTSWILVLGPLFAAGGDGLLATVLSLAYPVGDVVTITMLIFAILRARLGGEAGRQPLYLIGLGLTAIALSDSAFVYLTSQTSYGSGSFIDIGWFVGFAVLFVAARRPERAAPRAHEEHGLRSISSLTIAYAPVVVMAVTVLLQHLIGETLDGPAEAAAMAVLLLIVLRQVLTLRENFALVRNLEERVESRTSELRRGEERFRSLVQNSSDVVTIADADGTIRYLSPSVRRVFGYEYRDLLGTSLAALIAPKQRGDFREALWQSAVEPGGPTVGEFLVVDSGGRVRPAEITITNLIDDPNVGGLVLNTRDIGDQKRLQDELSHQAFHDSLTGLANRALFKDRVEHALLRTRRRRRPLAVLFLDLDRFKAINDSFGHASGDALLTAVSQRLSGCVRAEDTVARLGGDEFAVLVENLAGDAELELVAERIRDTFREPIVIDGRELVVAASVGIALSHTGDETADDLLRNADLAMYRAKSGGGGARLYHPEMHAGIIERLELESDLRHALAREELYLVYQPIVDLATGRVSGAEALLRWQHPVRGVVSPVEFIPVAESTGLIVPIGEWVLRQACRDARRWSDLPGGEQLSVSVNLSGRQLQTSELASVVPQALLEAGLAPERLMLEMTESVMIDGDDETLAVLHELRRLGLRLGLDDFGTGYSSLSYLHRFPIDVIKIDRSFVERLTGEGDEASLADSIVRIAHGLRVTTVAEGIEDRAQLRALQTMGCDHGQGYHFARPMSGADFERYIAGTGSYCPVA
ncbi:MAG TPA: EAL domain-containing protein [Acidimicrobiia bacterium]|nr:EAL domain-containing protein [Acidimicrobiia bacterium]